MLLTLLKISTLDIKKNVLLLSYAVPSNELSLKDRGNKPYSNCIDNRWEE